jgi:putative ABC transport system permease protein
VALGLALLGIYGVMMAAVTERVPEIGVRMVLGASPARIRRMIASEGAWLVGSGITVGIGAALAASGVLAAFVFGVSATDPATVTLAALAVALSGMLAGLLPAHRAARVDPAATLRGE